MISKLSFLGSFLEPNKEQMVEIMDTVNGFIKGKLNIATSRIPAPPNLGGVGMLELEDFLKSQKCAWISRAYGSTDLWSSVIKRAGLCDPDSFENKEIGDDYLILSKIFAAFVECRKNFLEYNDNLAFSRIFLNPILKQCDYNVINSDIPDLQDTLKKITVNNIVSSWRVLSAEQINVQLGGVADPLIVSELIKAGREAVKYLKKNLEAFGPDPGGGGGKGRPRPESGSRPPCGRCRYRHYGRSRYR
jgi:hypothetical protein